MQPLIATFSIVARDPVNGDLAVAVQSKFLAVGAVVSGLSVGPALAFAPGEADLVGFVVLGVPVQLATRTIRASGARRRTMGQPPGDGVSVYHAPLYRRRESA